MARTAPSAGGIFGRKKEQRDDALGDVRDAEKEGLDTRPITIFRARILIMGLLVSLGGIVFGYDTGQISGFLEMDDFKLNFGEFQAPPGTLGDPNALAAAQLDPRNYSFSNSREGTIVGLLSIGTLVGVLVNGFVADALGRRLAIVTWCSVFSVGLIIQIASFTSWIQLAIGRLIAGIGVGGLSVMTPMYQSETCPRQIRGAMVCAYQLFITFGIFLADAINLGTEGIPSCASWRITIGIGFIFPAVMGVGIMFLRESPRWDYRQGKTDAARKTIALSYGVPENHVEVVREFSEIKEKFEAETVGGAKHPWYEIFTGPRMAYRTILGITLQILQQLTGANYFFYFATTVFNNVGLNNSYVTALILGAVNFGSTFFGLYVVETFGRRKALTIGGSLMFIFFMIYASVGAFVLDAPNITDSQRQMAGNVLIAFTCLFIVSYATTWGPIIWTLVPELYPSRYRAKSMGLATAGNWTFNFLIGFFTSYISSDIGLKYGYVFAGCNFAGVLVVYFFVCETQGRTLEEIDTMYIMRVKPWKSTSWKPPVGERLGETDHAYLTPGGRDIIKPKPERGDAQVEKAGESSSGMA